MTIRWLRVKELFAGCLALPAPARDAFLDDACRGDRELRDEVASLVTAYEQSGDFLEMPAVIPAAAVAPGARLGPYEVLERVGAGGMGEVYRARDVRLDRIVALKILPPSSWRDAAVRRRFEREARMISSLSHPHICALFDIGSQDGVDFLVMEYLEGETLARRLERGPLPHDELVRHGLEIADALEHAHRQGVIHRDLKPSNVVLTESGATLVDFGIAKLHDAEAERDEAGPPAGVALTHHGGILGTVAYMSPEQVRGEALDARSDLFSFGAVLYEMAVGRRPFPGEEADEVRAAIRAGAMVPVSETGAEVHPHLAAVLTKALAPDREGRYQRAAEMRRDLQRVRTAPRRSWLAAVVAALVLLAAVAGVLIVGRSAPATPAAPVHTVAVLPFRPLVPLGGDEDYLGVAIADALVTELGVFSSIDARPGGAGGADTAALGRALKAELVLDGAIQRSENRLRVSARLVRVADGRTVWSDRFDTPWTDVFEVQDAIAGQVARALAVTLTREDRARVLRRRTASVEAYEAYLRGRYFWNLRTAAGFQKAIQYFQQAIERDSAYAPAHAGLADTFSLLGSMPYAELPPREASARARASATRALALDDTLAEAHVSLAFATYSFEWDWAGGERGFRRAIELDPTYVPAHYWYSLFLGQSGRLREQLAEARRARELDPLSPIGGYAVALAYYYDRRFADAQRAVDEALEIAPEFPPVRRLLGSLQVAVGRPDLAVDTLRRLRDAGPRNTLNAAWYAYALGRAGDLEAARAEVDRLVADARVRFVPAAHIGIAAIGVGDTDAAFAWLERAYAERSQALTFLGIEPMFDPIRPDPRFADLLARVGLAR